MGPTPYTSVTVVCAAATATTMRLGNAASSASTRRTSPRSSRAISRRATPTASTGWRRRSSLEARCAERFRDSALHEGTQHRVQPAHALGAPGGHVVVALGEHPQHDAVVLAADRAESLAVKPDD